MGLIINIAEGLENRADYNILHEPIKDMFAQRQEAFEKSNPIDLLFKRGTLSTFQETYTSSIGFRNAFAETGDYGNAPIFNTHEGFSTVYTSRTFQGGFVITQQLIEDQSYNTIKNTAAKFLTRWHGDTVEYAMTAISAGFGLVKTFGGIENGGESQLELTTADTADGNTMTKIKNPLFSINHVGVKRKTMSAAELFATKQSNIFAVNEGATYGIDLDGSDTGKVAKLADIINQVITYMENLKDDNGKFSGVSGAKRIVAPNDARLKAMIESALDMPMFNDIGQFIGPNPSYKRATLDTTPYLRDLDCCYNKSTNRGIGFFIVDDAYNAENNGPEFTERIALTMNVEQTKNPYGISYDARQRFDINVATWRGIAYVYIGSTAPSFVSSPSVSNAGVVTTVTEWNAVTALTPIATIVKPVSVVGTVTTETETGTETGT